MTTGCAVRTFHLIARLTPFCRSAKPLAGGFRICRNPRDRGELQGFKKGGLPQPPSILNSTLSTLKSEFRRHRFRDFQCRAGAAEVVGAELALLDHFGYRAFQVGAHLLFADIVQHQVRG